MGDDKKQNNDFLNEIQAKINKRSGGLYYNQKLKSIKKTYRFNHNRSNKHDKHK